MTLIEICCAILLLGFIGSLAIHSYSGNHILARIELNRIYAALVYARRKAILEQRTQRISFTHHTDGIDMVLLLAPRVLFAVPEEVKGPPGNPTQILKKAITFKHETLEAFCDGTITAGALYITDNAYSCLYALTVDASAITGLRRYRYIFSSALWEVLE